ncbi:glycosyltransferase family 4 protein [Patescibacteria group bacterium]|nr:glycosyltransferase family 4 protein [Patescibacteria group bacterium]
MRFLIITQKVDENDDILGFFHRWIEEFAKHCENVIVVCLQKEEYDLPANVKVLSLGKEKGKSRLKYIFNFYKYIWQERKNYDAVFVHMNQEYVLLGGLFWKFFGKKIFMWRNHGRGNIFTRIAIIFSDKVFCTSKYSYTAKFKKTEIMPVGIDTEKFFAKGGSASGEKIQNSILSLGRISPIKNTHVLIEALRLLDEKGVDFIANIYGNAPKRDLEYYKKIRKFGEGLEKKRKLFFHKGIPNPKTPEIYSKHQFFINLTPEGSFDKTILEAMACRILVIYSNKFLKGKISDILLVNQNDPINLAQKIEFLFNQKKAFFDEIGKKGEIYVIENHSLSLLMEKLMSVITKKCYRYAD